MGLYPIAALLHYLSVRLGPAAEELDFLELFAGDAALSRAMASAGLRGRSLDVGGLRKTSWSTRFTGA